MSTFTVLVREGKDLPNMDKKDLTDAFVQVDYGGKKEKTKVVKDSLNPRWDETFTFTKGGAQDISFRVYDSDTLVDDFIGQCVVPLSRAPFEDWLQLTNKKSMPAGYLLVRVDDGRRAQGQGQGHGNPPPQSPQGAPHGGAAPTGYAQPPFGYDYRVSRYDGNYDRYDRANPYRGARGYPNKYDKLYDRYEARRYNESRYGYDERGSRYGGYEGGRYHERDGRPYHDDLPPRRWDDVPPRRHAESPSRRYDDMPPRRYDDAPPRRYGDLPPRRWEDDYPPRRYEDRYGYSDMPPRRYGDLPPRRYADLPPRRYEDLPPYEEVLVPRYADSSSALARRSPPRYVDYTLTRSPVAWPVTREYYRTPTVTRSLEVPYAGATYLGPSYAPVYPATTSADLLPAYSGLDSYSGLAPSSSYLSPRAGYKSSYYAGPAYL